MPASVTYARVGEAPDKAARLLSMSIPPFLLLLRDRFPADLSRGGHLRGHPLGAAVGTSCLW